MKHTMVLITGILLIYSGILSMTRKNANFANIGLILIGFLMMIYFLWKNKTISKITCLRNKN